jgi:hypothetical protein
MIADEFLEGPAPPPCELSYADRVHDHPRFPSGDCVVCGALCTEICKHQNFDAWAEFVAWTPDSDR